MGAKPSHCCNHSHWTTVITLGKRASQSLLKPSSVQYCRVVFISFNYLVICFLLNPQLTLSFSNPLVWRPWLKTLLHYHLQQKCLNQDGLHQSEWRAVPGWVQHIPKVRAQHWYSWQGSGIDLYQSLQKDPALEEYSHKWTLVGSVLHVFMLMHHAHHQNYLGHLKKNQFPVPYHLIFWPCKFEIGPRKIFFKKSFIDNSRSIWSK